MNSTELESSARSIRKRFLRMHFENNAGHIGTGLSSIELLTYIHKAWLRDSEGDRFVLSKGHGASALYATLHHFGKLSDADLATYYKDATHLPAHPAPNAFSAIPAATGSLGHGFPIATGMAYAEKKLAESRRQVTALLSDGECNEGSNWEAALFAGHHKLENLTAVIDANGLQGFGRTSDVLNMEPLAEKWKAFGFDVREINGHKFEEIDRAFQKPRDGRPVCVLARTVKGKGVSFMENKLEWHYLPMKAEQYEAAMNELENSGARS